MCAARRNVQHGICSRSARPVESVIEAKGRRFIRKAEDFSVLSSGSYKVAGAVARSGFRVLRVLDETVSYRYASAEEWWETRWSHFGRLRLEHLREEALTAFKADVFAHLERMQTAGELRSDMQVLYTIAAKE